MNSAIRYLANGLAVVGLLFVYGYLHAVYAKWRGQRDEQEAKDMFWQFSGVVMIIAGFVFALWVAFILFFVVSDIFFGLTIVGTRSMP